MRRFNRPNYKVLRIRKLLIWIVIILLFFLLISIVHTTNALGTLLARFVYMETEYHGLENLESQALDVYLAEYKGKSMFEINPDEISKLLEDNFIEISSIKAEKFYPDKIVFTLEEKKPVLVISNFNGKFLLDDEGQVLKSICREGDKVKFNYYDYLFARGFGDVNADYIEDRVFQQLPEDVDIEEFNFEEFSLDEKKAILTSLQQERKALFEGEINYVLENINLGLGKELFVLKSWSEDCFAEGEKVDEEVVNFWIEVFGSIKQSEKFFTSDSYWDGEYRLFIKVNNSTNLIFSPSRPVENQIEDLNIVLNHLEKSIEDFKVIDLTSRKVLVE